MRVQKKDGEIVDCHPSMARKHLEAGGSYVNQAPGTASGTKARQDRRKRPAKKKATKKAVKVTVKED